MKNDFSNGLVATHAANGGVSGSEILDWDGLGTSGSSLIEGASGSTGSHDVPATPAWHSIFDSGRPVSFDDGSAALFAKLVEGLSHLAGGTKAHASAVGGTGPAHSAGSAILGFDADSDGMGAQKEGSGRIGMAPPAGHTGGQSASTPMIPPEPNLPGVERGRQSGAEAGPVSPTIQQEVSYINGLNPDNTITSTSFWGYRGVTANKWGASTAGTGATISYSFDAASNFSPTEKATFLRAFDQWSSVANVRFVEASSSTAADVLLQRGNDGSAYETGPVTLGSGSTLGSHTGQALISIDTSVTGFDLSGSLGRVGGYGYSTVVHEVGHLLGLGHGGPYNGSVNVSTDQYSAYDERMYTIMSYIYWGQAGTAKYGGSYPVTGTDWGITDDNYERQAPHSVMQADILAIQQLYGAAPNSQTAFDGGDVFGFNSNITGRLKAIFDFSLNTDPVVTLYDQGTGNTLDLSGFSEGAQVNLNAGAFSSVGGHVNNIAIARNTVIETAIGGSGDDTILGNQANNRLVGNDGADTLNGGSGTDTMAGGLGDDTYYVDNSGDLVTETSVAGSGTDTVYAYASFNLGTRGANVETIRALAGGLSITGNGGNNRLYDFVSSAGTILSGAGGNDTYFVRNAASTVSGEDTGGGTDTVYASVSFDLGLRGANVENIVAYAAGLSIGGNGLNNFLYDWTTGGSTMSGAGGNDIYYVRSGSSLISGETTSGGTDAAYASASFDLGARGANVENIYALAAGLTIGGNGLGNSLYDFAAAGSTMKGAGGNDFYFVRNSGSMILGEAASGGGTDTVYAYTSFDLGARGANVENILASAAGLSITGNGGANRLDDFATGAGTTMAGGLGNDLYVVHNAASTITGESTGGGTDTVYAYKSFDLGVRGANVENIFAFAGGLAIGGNNLGNGLYDSVGGAGTTMAGGLGNDVYYVRNAASTITGESTGGGADTVYAYTSFDLGAKGANVENILANAGGLSIAGNGLNNFLYDWTATGSTLAGAGGDDAYYVRNSGSKITELAGGGTDRVYAYASFDLSTRGANVETLYAAAAGLKLTGNDGANTIVGSTGAETLGGRLGLDTLTGNAGADTFVFDTAAGAANFDTLTDFSHADDTISLSKAVFAGLTGGAGSFLGEAQFHAVLSSQTYETDDRIVYQTDTGRLYYDADGYGAGTADAVQIALLANRPQDVAANDFLLTA